MKTEKLEVKKVHDNNKYLLSHKVVQEVDGDKLVQIYQDITKAVTQCEADIEKNKKDMIEAPKQLKANQEKLEADLKLLKERQEEFSKYAKGLVREKEIEEETVKNTE